MILVLYYIIERVTDIIKISHITFHTHTLTCTYRV